MKKKQWLLLVPAIILLFIACTNTLQLEMSLPSYVANQTISMQSQGNISLPELPETAQHLQGTAANNENNVESYTLSGKLLAVGDIMMHAPQFPAYVDPQTGTYKFNSYFSQVKPILETGDWCWANLETPLLGGEKVYTGYPMFNAPPALADALKYAGFNIVTTANNHALDRHEQGLVRTLKVLQNRNFATKGTAASLWESKQATIVEKNGIRLGILAYTYGTNGIPLPKQKPYLVSLIDEKRIIENIQKTKEAGADIVAIALHMGDEYEAKPTPQQKQLSRKLVHAGADIILGSHPHVLQPYEWVTVPTIEGQARKGIIIYSLGNFISNQTGNGKDIGVIFGVEMLKHMPEGRMELKKITIEPTWVQIDGPRGKRKYRVLPLSNTAQTYPFKQLQHMFKRTKEHLQSMLNEPDAMDS